MFGQSPWLCDPPLAANIACGPSYVAAGEPVLVPFDEELPAAMATVAQTAAATSTAATANQRLGRVDLASLMRTSFLVSGTGESWEPVEPREGECGAREQHGAGRGSDEVPERAAPAALSGEAARATDG